MTLAFVLVVAMAQGTLLNFEVLHLTQFSVFFEKNKIRGSRVFIPLATEIAQQ